MLLIFFKYLSDLLFVNFSMHIVKIFHKLVLWLININVEKEGDIPENNKGILFVSNHISYVDIPVLGSILPLRFVAKAEVKDWPILGKLAQIGNTIFIERLKSNISIEKDTIEKNIFKGDKILLFPEGTTSDGLRVLNFKSSLLSSVEKKNYFVQPIVISYKVINGMPLTRWIKPVIAWYGDMEFKSHLINLIMVAPINVKVMFLSPINSIDFSDRKSMTKFLQNVINEQYSKNNPILKWLAESSSFGRYKNMPRIFLGIWDIHKSHKRRWPYPELNSFYQIWYYS